VALYRRRGYSARRSKSRSRPAPDLASDEVVREIGAGDATERAMTDLTGAGLICKEGVMILLTRAALHFDRLAA